MLQMYILHNPYGQQIIGVCPDAQRRLEWVQQSDWGKAHGPWKLVYVTGLVPRSNALSTAKLFREIETNLIEHPFKEEEEGEFGEKEYVLAT